VLPLAGVALAVLFLWRGFGILPADAGSEAAEPAPTGNAAFDAYRAEMLRRLETERAQFEAFLDRLRQSRDKSEFDEFMENRARRAREEQAPDDGRPHAT